VLRAEITYAEVMQGRLRDPVFRSQTLAAESAVPLLTSLAPENSPAGFR
jgi:hypothetical protein